jgi:hypothetical protein
VPAKKPRAKKAVTATTTESAAETVDAAPVKKPAKSTPAKAGAGKTATTKASTTKPRVTKASTRTTAKAVPAAPTGDTASEVSS